MALDIFCEYLMFQRENSLEALEREYSTHSKTIRKSMYCKGRCDSFWFIRIEEKTSERTALGKIIGEVEKLMTKE